MTVSEKKNTEDEVMFFKCTVAVIRPHYRL
jgi:hypothetical protein